MATVLRTPLSRAWPSLASLPVVGSLVGGISSLLELLPPITLAVPKSKISHSRKSMRSANKGIKNKTSECLYLYLCPVEWGAERQAGYRGRGAVRGRHTTLEKCVCVGCISRVLASSCAAQTASARLSDDDPTLEFIHTGTNDRLHQLRCVRHPQTRTQPVPDMLLASITAMEGGRSLRACAAGVRGRPSRAASHSRALAT